jgi:hypothetical protein
MFKEYDVVEAIEELSSTVKVGSIGTILICYGDNDYEVEFLDSNGETLDVLTVSGVQLRLR